MNGTLAGILAIVMFAVSNVMAASVSEIPGFQLAAMTLFLGFVSMTLMQLVRREDIASYWKQPLPHYAFITWGVGLYTALLYLSYRFAPPFEANSLNYLWPILLVAFTGIMQHKSLSLSAMVGVFLGFSGTIIIFIPGLTFSTLLWGHALALAAALIWALYSTLARDKNYPAGFIAPALLFSSLLCMIFHFALEPTIFPQGWHLVMVLLLGLFRVAYAFWDYGMRHGNVILLASLSYFIPLVSTGLFIWAGFLPHHPLIAVGAVLIILGCLLVNMRVLRTYLSAGLPG